MNACSDNVHFGSQVAQQLLDATETGSDSASMANLHNNEAGRRVKNNKITGAGGDLGNLDIASIVVIIEFPFTR